MAIPPDMSRRIGNYYETQGRFEEAEKQRQSEAFVAGVSKNGGASSNEGNLSIKMKLWELSMLETNSGKENEGYAKSLQELGVLYQDAERKGKALDSYRAALEIYNRLGNQGFTGAMECNERISQLADFK